MKELLHKLSIEAVIFDLDGTLIDNNAFHLQSWKQYLKDIGKHISEEAYKAHINGRTNKDAVEYIYGRQMSDEEAMIYTLQKEEIYRSLYQPFIKPVKGLVPLLEKISALNMPMAIATSGIQVNIDFMFSHIPIQHYFKAIVNSAHIKTGKPDPEIYFKTAELLKVNPEKCLVFEDAVVGVQAAKAAGMKVFAITTTHTADELKDADRIIAEYSSLLTIQ